MAEIKTIKNIDFKLLITHNQNDTVRKRYREKL